VTDRGELRGLVRDNLSRLIPLLLAAVAAPIIALLADLPTWATWVAAAAALVSVVLIVIWLPLPRSAWRADHSRRIVLVAIPLTLAVVMVGIGFAVRLGAGSRDVRSAAMLILVDSSQEMGAGVPAQPGSGTKLEAATRSVRQHVIDNQFEQVGLASFGDPCGSEEPLRELVPIAFDRKEAIAGELTGLQPTGDRNLVSAASNALSLLEPFGEAKWRRLVIVTGGLDGCGRGLPDLIENWRGRDVDLTWDLVGLGLSDQEKQEASALQGDGVAVHLADTPDELDDALSVILRETPIRQGLDEIRSYVTRDVRDPLQEAADALARGDLGTVQQRLDAVESLIESAADRFLTIDTAGANQVYDPMVQKLREMVDLQRRYVDLLRQRLAIAQDTDVDELDGQELEEWNTLTQRSEEIVQRYNEDFDELESIIEDIIDELFG
jgi:hypothetical protein